MNGTIKKKVSEKGFGFIKVDGSDDVFFHRDGLSGVSFDEISEGDAVSFDTEDGPKGKKAVNVKRA